MLLVCDGYCGVLMRVKVEGVCVDGCDLNMFDYWVVRYSSLVRLTGTYSFNCEFLL